MFKAALLSGDDYHQDEVIGTYKSQKRAAEVVNMEYNKLSASDKLYYHPVVMLVK